MSVVSKWLDLLRILAEAYQRCIPVYDPASWNTGMVKSCNNCYNYATNIKTNTFAQPGSAHGIILGPDDMECDAVANGAVADGLRSSPEPSCGCSDCCHVVALVIAPDIDYHWYRLDRNGTWSHKPGRTPATNLDNSGNIINDPRTADRGMYSVFCGFYCVCEAAVTVEGPGCNW